MCYTCNCYTCKTVRTNNKICSKRKLTETNPRRKNKHRDNVLCVTVVLILGHIFRFEIPTCQTVIIYRVCRPSSRARSLRSYGPRRTSGHSEFVIADFTGIRLFHCFFFFPPPRLPENAAGLNVSPHIVYAIIGYYYTFYEREKKKQNEQWKNAKLFMRFYCYTAIRKAKTFIFFYN